jgi:hypothetical protein
MGQWLVISVVLVVAVAWWVVAFLRLEPMDEHEPLDVPRSVG